MSSVTFLGTACGIPMPDHFHSSILLETGGHKYLLDAGEPCSHRLLALGHKHNDIDAVFITHAHSDHIAGLPMFIQGCWLEKRDRPLPIYLPAEIIAPLRQWLSAVYLPDSILGYQPQFIPWEESFDVTINNLQVRAAATTHLNGLKSKIEPEAHTRFKAYSLTFQLPDKKRLLYSGDLGAPADLDPQLDKPVDLLICELSHYYPADLFSYLKGKSIEKVCLTHLCGEFAEKVDELLALGTKELNRELQVAQENLTLTI